MAQDLNLQLAYFHYSWEEKHKALKALSYLCKFVATLWFLIRKKPHVVFVQLAPTPALYAVALYAFFTGVQYISDCHNTMLYDGHWLHWPLAKKLLKRSSLVLVHNEEVKAVADKLGIMSIIYMDPPPAIVPDRSIQQVAGINLKTDRYILLPCNMAADDEPAEAFFAAARQLSHIRFVLTGYIEKIPAYLRPQAPANVHYTGFLAEDAFNALYAHAHAAIVLSTREGTQPSGASEAIALGIPLLVTDLLTTRKIYKDWVMFTRNTADSLVQHIGALLEHREQYASRIAFARLSIEKQTNAQRLKLQECLHSLNTQDLSTATH
ncbi:glycosyltransferase [Cesiribacter andamanensis]|uniref:glycosyltransferase n=1 Tax=Cesiribacter andamanensis TaxID=649507 RepID=UPI00034B2A49|nr:glycosyltransferase [Cesiribacter andamanensis]